MADAVDQAHLGDPKEHLMGWPIRSLREREAQAIKNGRDLKLGLDQAFILRHVAYLAGGTEGLAFESFAEMKKDLGDIGKHRLRDGLNALVDQGLLGRTRRSHKSTIYWLTSQFWPGIDMGSIPDGGESRVGIDMGSIPDGGESRVGIDMGSIPDGGESRVGIDMGSIPDWGESRVGIDMGSIPDWGESRVGIDMGQFPAGGNGAESIPGRGYTEHEREKETDPDSVDVESSFSPSPGRDGDFTDEILQALNDYGRVGPGPGMWHSFMGAVKTYLLDPSRFARDVKLWEAERQQQAKAKYSIGSARGESSVEEVASVEEMIAKLDARRAESQRFREMSP